nr:immunoglobulin heavy chain junction region [Macaca mulatta]
CARHKAVFRDDHYHTDWFDYW